jgi:hypothetical protein
MNTIAGEVAAEAEAALRGGANVPLPGRHWHLLGGRGEADLQPCDSDRVG